MLGFAGWYDSRDGYTKFMFYYHFSNWFLLGPLVYYVVRAKTNQTYKINRQEVKHLIMPGLIYLYILICFCIDIVYKDWIMGETLVGFDGARGEWAQMPLGIFNIPMIILSYVSLFYYFWRSIKHYNAYRKYIVSELSIADAIDFKWIRNILYGLLAAVIVWFLFDLAELFITMTFTMDWWSYFFWGIVIYYITISGYRDDSHINNTIAFEPEVSQDSFYTNIDTVTTDLPIMEVMYDEAPYLKANLSLNDLARMLNTSPNQLSKVLNSEFNKNFNEFINDFRIKTVIQKLQDEAFSHYSILGIALECGFNSKATFNRVFKSHTGMSPSEYRKKKLADQ
jgi:AraC-like DNA-binding protein